MAQENKGSFVLYFDYRKHLEFLTDEECGRLFKALLDYGETKKQPELDGAALMAFSFIACQMDRDAQKYAETCRKRSESGKKGGRPKANASDGKAKKANGFPEKQTEAKKADNDNDNDNDTDTDNDTDNDINNNPPTPQGGTDAQERRFAEFWAAYPKKVGKQAARNSWKRVKPDAKLHERIMQAVAIAKKSEQWSREGGRFVPNPSTWLNQGRWDDELTPADTTQQHERKGQTHGTNSGHSEQPERHQGAGSETTLSGFRMADD